MAGDVVRVWMDRPGSATRRPGPYKTGALDILYEDDALIVLNKPAGLLSVPLERRSQAPSIVTLLEDYFRSSGKRKPFVVHRIDLDTSGLVLFAKTARAQAALKDQFRRREPERVYLAVVYGHPVAGAGHVARPPGVGHQGADPEGDPSRATRRAWTRCPTTAWSSALPTTSLIEVRLHTGKRNQIRIQARLRGHTLVGETRYVYGPDALAADRVPAPGAARASPGVPASGRRPAARVRGAAAARFRQTSGALASRPLTQDTRGRRLIVASRPPQSKRSRQLPDRQEHPMPTDLSLPGITGQPPFKKSTHLPAGVGDVSFEVTAQPGSATLAALATNAAFPAGRIDLESLQVTVSGNRDVPLGGAKGTVNFSGRRAPIKASPCSTSPATSSRCWCATTSMTMWRAGLDLERSDHRFLLLRWGYDLQDAAKGSLGLGAGPKVTFGAEGKRLGAYAVIRQIPTVRRNREMRLRTSLTAGCFLRSSGHSTISRPGPSSSPKSTGRWRSSSEPRTATTSAGFARTRPSARCPATSA